MESFVGTAMGGFKLTRALGAGPTGQTYEGVDSAAAPAAIKVIHPGLSLFTKAEAYWGELRKVGELAHPHITVAGAADWSKSGRFFLSMDLLEGISLEDALKLHTRLPAAQALLIVGQVCLALEAAHEVGVVHGALKPRNIFLVPAGGDPTRTSTRVMDFATLRLLGNAPAAGAPGSPGVPEPAYLAPEQFGGPATAASDLYSLGVILFELTSGRRPFAGSYPELATAHARQPLEIPSTIPAGLADVLRRALAKLATERFASVTELREALESWAASSPAALMEAPFELFAKEPPGAGVGQNEAEQTVKVSMDELSASVSEPEPAEGLLPSRPADADRAPAVTANEKKGQSMPDVKNPSKVPEDKELAAIAEKAATPLRSKPESAAAAVAATAAPQAAPAPKPTEAYLDDDDELVELPLEKSVRAFVANLLPVAPPPPRKVARANGNGESLEAALEQFVHEAKHLSHALPAPVVDDRRLAQLAKAPVIEEPPPPKAPLVSAPVSAAAPKRSIILPSLLSFVLGGGLVFGAYKLFLEKPPAPETQLTVTGGSSGTGESGGTAASPGTATPGTATPGTAAASPDTGPAAAAAAPKPDQGAATPDTAAAATAAKPDAAAPAVEPTPKKVAKVAKKVRKPAPKKKETLAVKPKKVQKTKKGGDEKKTKKGGSDWVDPFSQ